MNIGVILGSGTGERMGNMPCPKQFLVVEEKPIIQYTIEAFNNCSIIDKIIIVTNSEWIEYVEQLCEKNNINKLEKIVCGKKNRNESANEAMKYIAGIAKNEDTVIFHDAVRPLISDDILKNAAHKMINAEAVVVCLRTYDTLVYVDNNKVVKVDRNKYFKAQTPEYGSYKIIKKYYPTNDINKISKYTSVLLDFLIEDNCIIETVEGDEYNFKVTTAEDIQLLTGYIKTMKSNICDEIVNCD